MLEGCHAKISLVKGVYECALLLGRGMVLVCAIHPLGRSRFVVTPLHVVHSFGGRTRPLCIGGLLVDGSNFLCWFLSKGGSLGQVTTFDFAFIRMLYHGAHGFGSCQARHFDLQVGIVRDDHECRVA